MNYSENKIDVTLYLRGDELEPTTVSAILGVVPSKAHCKGDVTFTSTNREVVARTGLWSYAVKSKDKNISQMFTELNKDMGDVYHKVSQIKGLSEAYVDVFVAIDSVPEIGGTFEFELIPEAVTALNSLGIPVRFTIAAVPP